MCIVDDKSLSSVYEEFLQKNLAWENFGFYNAVNEFKTNGEGNISSEAAKIFEKYIEVDSAHELGDITLELRDHVKAALEDPKITMFDELLDIVVESLVNSTVTDFLSDEIFTSYVDNVFENDNNVRTNAESRGIFSIFSCWGG